MTVDHEQEHMERAAWDALRGNALDDMRSLLRGDAGCSALPSPKVLEMAEEVNRQMQYALRKYYAAEKWLEEHPLF